MKVEARVEREPGEKNFSCYMHIDSLNCGVLGVGSSAKAAIKDMLSGWKDETDELREEGKEIPELEIEYKFDVGSLFNYYDYQCVRSISRNRRESVCHAPICDRHKETEPREKERNHDGN